MTTDVRTNMRHKVANARLVPFAIGLLESHGVKGARASVHLGGRDALTLECVEVLSEVIRRGTLGCLSRRVGHRRLRVPVTGREGPQRLRLWETDWGGLRFTHRSLDLIRCGFDVALGPTRDAAGAEAAGRALSAIEAQHSGDQLVHHLLFRARGDALDSSRFAANPLNGLSESAPWGSGAALTVQLERTGDLISAFGEGLPWLGELLAERWLELEPLRWARSEDFDGVTVAQTRAFDAWIGATEAWGRPDLLRPLMRFFSELLRRHGPTERLVERFTALHQGRRLRERQQLGVRFCGLLDRADTLERAYEAVRSVHPVDREPAGRAFMGAYLDGGMGATIPELRRLGAALRPRLG